MLIETYLKKLNKLLKKIGNLKIFKKLFILVDKIISLSLLNKIILKFKVKLIVREIHMSILFQKKIKSKSQVKIKVHFIKKKILKLLYLR